MRKLINDRYNYFRSLSIDDKRQWNTLFIIFPFAFIMLLLYFLKYNLKYEVSEYNGYFCSLFLLLVVIITMGLVSKKKDFAFITYLFALTLAVFFMIFVSGGVKAPGLNWLTMLGPVYGLFYKKRGVFIGMILSMILFGVYFFLDRYGLNPNVILQHANYQVEKNSNFFTFLIFMGSNFLAYAIAYERADKELKEKNEQIEVFLRILFHDVANPLAIISVTSDMMIKRKDFNEAGVMRIKTASNNLKDQLESVKKLKALQDGKYVLDINHFKVLSMIEAAIDIFAEKAAAKKIRVVVNCNEPDLMVKVDSVVFINQIISNILSNSVKFSHPDSEIHVFVKSSPASIRIDIQDFGIGMSEEIKNHLFDVEKVISRAGTNKESGTGYGISLAKYFIESFGGTIDVSSIPQTETSINHGTTFTISFPKR